jgi:hypothetical protein
MPKTKLGTEPKPAHRPEKEIDKKKFETLVGVHHMTAKVIAIVLEVSESTIRRYAQKEYGKSFDFVKADFTEGLHGRLSAKQYELAMSGDKTMLIWLGKQYLGQAEKVEKKVENNIQGEITYVSEWGGRGEAITHQGDDDPTEK